MKVTKVKERKSRITALAKSPNYQVSVTANLKSTALSASELDEVKRKITHKMTLMMSKLPYTDLFPHEVKIQ